MMKQIQWRIVILRFTIICNTFIQQATATQSVLKSLPFEKYMVETMIPSYCVVYTTFNEHIVQNLLKVDIEANESVIQALVHTLLCAAKHIHTHLERVVEAMELLAPRIDQEIIDLSLSISHLEQQLHQTEKALAHANILLQNAQNQVISTAKVVRDAEQSCIKAKHGVYNAHEEVKRARQCYLKQRNGLLGFIIDLLIGLAKPVCKIVNAGNIKRAKAVRELAEQRVRDTYQRFHTHQMNFANQLAHVRATEMQLNGKKIELETTKTFLNQKRTQQLSVASLIKQFRDIELYFNNVLSSSEVFLNEVKKLIDFELIIEPLNNIYNDMSKLNIFSPVRFNILNDTIHQMNSTIEKLTDKLPKLPLNLMISVESNTCYLQAKASVSIYFRLRVSFNL